MDVTERLKALERRRGQVEVWASSNLLDVEVPGQGLPAAAMHGGDQLELVRTEHA